MKKRTACDFKEYKKPFRFTEDALRTVGGWFTAVKTVGFPGFSWLQLFNNEKSFMEPILCSMKENTENFLSDIFYDMDEIRERITKYEDVSNMQKNFVLDIIAPRKNGVDNTGFIAADERSEEYLDVFVITCDQDEYGTKSITTWVRDHYDDDDEDIPCW